MEYVGIVIVIAVLFYCNNLIQKTVSTTEEVVDRTLNVVATAAKSAEAYSNHTSQKLVKHIVENSTPQYCSIDQLLEAQKYGNVVDILKNIQQQ